MLAVVEDLYIRQRKKTSVQESLRNSSKWIIANSFIFLRIAILLIKKTY